MVSFSNASSVRCVLDDLRVASSSGFRISDGGVDQLALRPGQEHEVWLAGPDAGSIQVGWLTFHVLGPGSVVQSIQLIPPR